MQSVVRWAIHKSFNKQWTNVNSGPDNGCFATTIPTQNYHKFNMKNCLLIFFLKKRTFRKLYNTGRHQTKMPLWGQTKRGMYQNLNGTIFTWPLLGYWNNFPNSLAISWPIWPVDVTELFPRVCCWTLIRLSHHWAYLHWGYWCYRSLIDWSIDWSQDNMASKEWRSRTFSTQTHCIQPGSKPYTNHLCHIDS